MTIRPWEHLIAKLAARLPRWPAARPARPARSRTARCKSTHGAWSIICDTPAGASVEQCVMMQNVVAEDRPELGLSVVMLRTADRKAEIMRVLAPLGVLLPNGLGLNIDKQGQSAAPISSVLRGRLLCRGDSREAAARHAEDRQGSDLHRLPDARGRHRHPGRPHGLRRRVRRAALRPGRALARKAFLTQICRLQGELGLGALTMRYSSAFLHLAAMAGYLARRAPPARMNCSPPPIPAVRPGGRQGLRLGDARYRQRRQSDDFGAHADGEILGLLLLLPIRARIAVRSSSRRATPIPTRSRRPMSGTPNIAGSSRTRATTPRTSGWTSTSRAASPGHISIRQFENLEFADRRHQGVRRQAVGLAATRSPARCQFGRTCRSAARRLHGPDHPGTSGATDEKPALTIRRFRRARARDRRPTRSTAPTTANSISNSSESEALMFDNGRLKTANFSTDQGFGLRAVAGEATGYAHSSELSEAALLRAADAVSAVKGGYSGTLAEAPAAHQPAALRRREPDRLAVLRGEGEAAAGDRRACCAPAIRACAR